MHPSTVPPDLPISPKNPHLPRLLLSNLLHHFYPTDEKAVKETWLFVANRHLQLFINSARLLGWGLFVLCELALESEWWRLRGLIFGLVWVYWMGRRFFGGGCRGWCCFGELVFFFNVWVSWIVGNKRKMDGEWCSRKILYVLWIELAFVWDRIFSPDFNLSIPSPLWSRTIKRKRKVKVNTKHSVAHRWSAALITMFSHLGLWSCAPVQCWRNLITASYESGRKWLTPPDHPSEDKLTKQNDLVARRDHASILASRLPFPFSSLSCAYVLVLVFRGRRLPSLSSLFSLRADVSLLTLFIHSNSIQRFLVAHRHYAASLARLIFWL